MPARTWSWWRLGAVVVLALVWLFPLYWMAVTAVSPRADVISGRIGLVPSTFSPDGLQRALGDHRDSVILQELLLRAADRARDKDRDTFGHGVLFAHEASVQEAALARAERHLAHLG